MESSIQTRSMKKLKEKRQDVSEICQFGDILALNKNDEEPICPQLPPTELSLYIDSLSVESPSYAEAVKNTSPKKKLSAGSGLNQAEVNLDSFNTALSAMPSLSKYLETVPEVGDDCGLYTSELPSLHAAKTGESPVLPYIENGQIGFNSNPSQSKKHHVPPKITQQVVENKTHTKLYGLQMKITSSGGTMTAAGFASSKLQEFENAVLQGLNMITNETLSISRVTSQKKEKMVLITIQGITADLVSKMSFEDHAWLGPNGITLRASLKHARYVVKGVSNMWECKPLRDHINRSNDSLSVSSVRFLGKKEGGNTILIETNQTLVARSIKLSLKPNKTTSSVRVEPYRAKKLVCFKCQAVESHRSNFCRSKVTKCAVCLQPGHKHNEGLCNGEKRCVFCKSTTHSSLTCKSDSRFASPPIPAQDNLPSAPALSNVVKSPPITTQAKATHTSGPSCNPNVKSVVGVPVVAPKATNADFRNLSDNTHTLKHANKHANKHINTHTIQYEPSIQQLYDYNKDQLVSVVVEYKQLYAQERDRRSELERESLPDAFKDTSRLNNLLYATDKHYHTMILRDYMSCDTCSKCTHSYSQHTQESPW